MTDEGHDHIGESTNNRAEYHALIQGLELASEKGCTEVEARGDSEVIVKQVRGEYGVNEPALRPLQDRAQELADEFKQFEIQHIPREENWEDTELVNQAFDGRVRPISSERLFRGVDHFIAGDVRQLNDK